MTDSKSKTEGRGKLKIGRKAAHDTRDSWPNLQVEKTKVKVIRRQVRTAADSLSKRRPQLYALVEALVAPPGE